MQAKTLCIPINQALTSEDPATAQVVAACDCIDLAQLKEKRGKQLPEGERGNAAAWHRSCRILWWHLQFTCQASAAAVQVPVAPPPVDTTEKYSSGFQKTQQGGRHMNDP